MGTPVDLDQLPSSRPQTPEETADFQQWAGLFYSWEAYKVLIQQKDNTDPAYRYPGEGAEALAISENGLNPAERQRLADIEKRLAR
jgi:hypothetical protein